MRLIEEIQRRLEEGWAVFFHLDDILFKVYPLDKVDFLYQEPNNGFFMIEFGRDDRIEKVAKELGVKVLLPTDDVILIPIHRIERIEFIPPPIIETFEDLRNFVGKNLYNSYREIGWALYNAGFEVGLDEGSDT